MKPGTLKAAIFRLLVVYVLVVTHGPHPSDRNRLENDCKNELGLILVQTANVESRLS